MRNARLCQVIEALGFRDVRSVLASGNIIFTSSLTDEALIERRLTEALQVELGIPGPVIVRSQKEIQQLLAANPFMDETHTQQTYQTVTFFAEKTKNPPLSNPDIIVHSLTDRELCMTSDSTKKGGADTMRLLQKTYGTNITTRTWKTIMRISQKFDTAAN